MSARRAEFIAGLRAFTDWLESNPQVQAPASQNMRLPLRRNADVESFAHRHGLEVAYDDEGNASTAMAFGPLTYRAFGYVDFDAHCAAADERLAREWAAQNGLQITEPPARAGLTEAELSATADGTYRCVCGHWDNVHGPHCYAESCRCGSFEHRSAR
ncbi:MULTISPECIES: hypothetical protein [unclassified Streptomyces]|uniref:hypothetical protein n=1 Tax=unclassified Streptomyces TaxID=2593676 RepID=UPI00226EF6CD|nr:MULTISPECIES: hypothetical protein [unclassified Streptomyces]MCY0921873.1 hypothetical protein [Streptomyces sp. H27-G5]MCY0957178.1 hypothetical protein [Streptomyces sp. H27-H5]